MTHGLFDLTGKVALLTGASRGMGLEMAKALATHGATVVLSARSQDTLDQAVEEVNALQGAGRAMGVTCNIGQKDQVENLVSTAKEQAGPIDVVIGNAGVNPFFGSMTDIPDEAYEKTLQANVQANLWLANLVVPDMAEKGSGSIAFTSSIGAFKPTTTLGAYNISKLALIGLVRNLAAEHGPQGIRCNAICPGLVKTEFARELWDKPDVERRITSQVPLGRLGEAEDFGGIAVFLASDASRYMTGQALTVCGGSSMWT